MYIVKRSSFVCIICISALNRCINFLAFRFSIIAHGRQPLGTNVGLMKEILLQEGETIVEVRFWKQEASSLALQFTTSSGIVYGPWGDPRTEETQMYQV